jgi:hypothetical protein
LVSEHLGGKSVRQTRGSSTPSYCPWYASGVWFEAGDAGRLPSTAQVTAGSGPLDTILGNLFHPDFTLSALDVDLYLIRIFDPLNFSAATVNAPGLYVSDPQLFLFTSAGTGVYMNDDDESGVHGSQSRLPAAHAFSPARPGSYFLGIGWWNNEPLSVTGTIFSSVNVSGTNGLDRGAGGANQVTAWNDNVLARLDLETAYEIALTGATFAIPEPTPFLLTGSALVWLFWRRRRR